MPLDKQPVSINFAQGVQTKNDPWQLPVGTFTRLVNSVFDTVGMLLKRNGFQNLKALPSKDYTYLTTFNGDLTAIGTNLAARSTGSNSWVVQGSLTPVRVASQSLIRSNLTQSQVDSATSTSNLVCVVYAETGNGSTVYKYAVSDSITGQSLIAPSSIPVNGVGTVDRPPRVFVLNKYFVILSAANNAGSYTLQATGIRLSDLTVLATTTLSTSYLPTTSIAMDGAVVQNALYIVYNATGGIKATYLTGNLLQGNTVTRDAAHQATQMSVCVDSSGAQPYIYAVYNDSAAASGYAFVMDAALASVLAPTQWSASANVLNISTAATGNVCSIFYEVSQPYAYDASIPNRGIMLRTVSRTGTLNTAAQLVKSLGIASKAFLVGNVAYLVGTYQSNFQSTYFLINSSGKVISKHAPSNGGGYVLGAPASVTVSGNSVQFSHLIKATIQAANKSQGVANPAGIYSQTGLNLTTVTFTTANLFSAETGKNLNLSGGFPWAYDGYTPTENGFFLWPDSVQVSTSASGGLITAQQYYYQAVYEWSDNQGNIFRSAPSLPVTVTTTGATSTNTIHVPCLRLTYKTTNKVKIVVYRWSAAQQNYYQVTSITSPLLSSTTVDYVDFVDTQADSAILGNSLLYTTGGVLENIQGPACESPALFDNRLWFINSEKGTELWYSKLITSDTPVETTDLQTYFVSPTIGSNNQLGPVRVLSPMDEKLVAFRADSIVYINGVGPDATGSNNQYSQPIFITSTVGCENANSVVMTPNGLMFQSNKGIWLLGRNLVTQYIGDPVESLTQGATVLSAFSVPGTNQVRFTMSSGIVLVYDYYVQQWAWFEGCPGISATIYQELHTYINALNEVRQELPGFYLDGSNPVLMSFTTSWLNLVGLQGYERFYEMYLLGKYYTPFKLNVGIALDYLDPIQQNVLITPDNYAPTWGGEVNWGAGQVWGGPGNVFEARVFPNTQKCEAFQLTVQELYDPTLGVAAGAGLTLSGLNLIIGAKKNRRTSTAAKSFG